mgnify:CR=1 FL=1
MKKLLGSILLATSLFASFEDELKSSYAQIEKALPIAITPDIQWTSVVIKDKRIYYIFDFSKKMQLEDENKEGILKTMCKEPTNKIILSNGYTLEAIYKYDEKVMSSILINKESCNYKDE